MNTQSTTTQFEQDDDFTRSARPVANVGKRFYTWATLGTFTGASFLVGGLWALMNRLNVPSCKSEGWPLLFSFLVIAAFAFASESEFATKRHQKVQKGLLALGNALLVYFIVVGGSGVVELP